MHCAHFPLPIITGIGHERDDTVLDVVANRRVKTPTAAAEFLIARVLETISTLDNLSQRLTDGVKQILYAEKQRINELQYQFPSVVKLAIKEQHHKLKNTLSTLKSSTKMFLTHKQFELEAMKSIVKNSSPEMILKRGYAIVRQDNQIITSTKNIDQTKSVSIEMKDGIIETKL